MTLKVGMKHRVLENYQVCSTDDPVDHDLFYDKVKFGPLYFCTGKKVHVYMHIWKRGSLVVSALAFSARCHRFDLRRRRGKISVSEYAFLSVICRDDDTK